MHSQSLTVSRKPRQLIWIAVVIVACAVSALELALLEIKYEIVRGGFLQSRQISGIAPVSAFIALVLGIQFSLFALLAATWNVVSRALRLHPVVSTYHFVVAFGGTMVALIALRYQLLNYFGDFFTFAVMKNLGGGNATDAILYGLREGVALGLFLVAGVLAYLLGHFLLVRRYGLRDGSRLGSLGQPGLGSSTTLALSAAIGLSTLILIANQWPSARYHLKKVVSYELPRSALDLLTDFDGDGVGFFAWAPDPAPFDSRKYPGALDIPGDGIDQDGLEGDFVYTPRERLSVTFTGKKRHLIVVVIESARADVLQAMVAGRPAVPFLQAMTQAGGHAERYFSHTGFTTSSIKAIFSGAVNRSSPLGGSLFALLSKQGYQVVVASGQDESFGGMAPELGMETHATSFFDATKAPNERVFPSRAPGSLTLANKRVLEAFAEAADRLDWHKPVFAYVNFQSPHFPYYYDGMHIHIDGLLPLKRNEISAHVRERLRLTYLNALSEADSAVRELVSVVKAKADLQDAVIVVSGDHGESLFDDGTLGHGTQIDDIQLRALFVASEPFPWLEGLLGQTDLAGHLLEAIGATLTPSRASDLPTATSERKEVFQLIGTLSSPLLLGFIDEDGDRLTFNVESREVWISTLKKWIPIRELEQYPEHRVRFRELIFEWERLRWEDYLSSGMPPTRQGRASTGRLQAAVGPLAPRTTSLSAFGDSRRQGP